MYKQGNLGKQEGKVVFDQNIFITWSACDSHLCAIVLRGTSLYNDACAQYFATSQPSQWDQYAIRKTLFSHVVYGGPCFADSFYPFSFLHQDVHLEHLQQADPAGHHLHDCTKLHSKQ